MSDLIFYTNPMSRGRIFAKDTGLIAPVTDTDQMIDN